MSPVNPPAAAPPRRPFGQSLAAYVLRRVGFALLTIWLVTTLVFVALRAMPSNPIDVFVNELMQTQGLSEDEARTRAAFLTGISLNKPLGEQYVDYMGNLLRGNLGASFRSQGINVGDMIAARLPWTLFSVGISLMVSFTLGVLLGTIAAYRRGTWIDSALTSLSAVLEAIPAQIIGVMLFLYLGVVWNVVPLDNMKGSLSPGVQPGFTAEFFADAFRHYYVLGFAYVLVTFGAWFLAMRSSVTSTLGEDYVTVAKARGLPDRRIITAYVGRNASLPLVTRLAISLGLAVGGSILFETIFTYQGIGSLLSSALVARDYPIVQGVVLISTVSVVVANLVTDFLYGWLDPRIRIAGSGN